LNGFCDKGGNINNKMPLSVWNIYIVYKGNSTFVDITINDKTLINLEKLLVMNFKEGFIIAFNGLYELIANFKIN
jgi:predicted transport protein